MEEVEVLREKQLVTYELPEQEQLLQQLQVNHVLTNSIVGWEGIPQITHCDPFPHSPIFLQTFGPLS